MKLKDLKEKQVFKIEFRGKVRSAEFIKINGTRAEVLFKGDNKPMSLSVESEILGVVTAKAEPKSEVVGEVTNEKKEVVTKTEKPKTTRNTKVKG